MRAILALLLCTTAAMAETEGWYSDGGETHEVADSAPTLANYGGAVEVGGRAPNAAGFADVYIGSMQDRSSGKILILLNRYGTWDGGLAEMPTHQFLWDGEQINNSHLTVGAT